MDRPAPAAVESAPASSPPRAASDRSALAWLLIEALLARAVLLPFSAYLPGGGKLDIHYWAEWMWAIHTYGILNIFQTTATNYVGYHWVLWLLALGYDLIDPGFAYYPLSPFQNAPLPLVLHVFLKLPSLLFDLALIVLVYAATHALIGRTSTALATSGARRPTQQAALLAAGVIAFLPPVLYDSAIWAQIDAGISATMLGAMLLVAGGRPGWGWAVWMAGLLMKPQPVIIAPVLLLLTLQEFDRRSSLLALLRGAGGAAAVAAVVLGPWVVHGELPRIVTIYQDLLFSRAGPESLALALGAWNLWFFWQARFHRSANTIGGPSRARVRDHRGWPRAGGAASALGAAAWRSSVSVISLGVRGCIAFHRPPALNHQEHLATNWRLLRGARRFGV